MPATGLGTADSQQTSVGASLMGIQEVGRTAGMVPTTATVATMAMGIMRVTGDAIQENLIAGLLSP